MLTRDTREKWMESFDRSVTIMDLAAAYHCPFDIAAAMYDDRATLHVAARFLGPIRVSWDNLLNCWRLDGRAANVQTMIQAAIRQHRAIQRRNLATGEQRR